MYNYDDYPTDKNPQTITLGELILCKLTSQGVANKISNPGNALRIQFENFNSY